MDLIPQEKVKTYLDEIKRLLHKSGYSALPIDTIKEQYEMLYNFYVTHGGV